MKTTTIRKALLLATLMVLSAFVLSGCFRKHIESSPPARRPATTAAPAPAPKPTVVEEKQEIIEETYIVDAPEEAATPAAMVEEDDLDAEPTPIKEEAVTTHEQKVEEIKAEAMDAVESAPSEAATPMPMGELYYIQVGAFSELENANNVLADLLEQGYKGSKMAKTENGFYRIQAGAFTDQEAADAALTKLLPDFPKGFVVKGMPEE